MPKFKSWVGKRVMLKPTSRFYNSHDFRGQVGTVQTEWIGDTVVVIWQTEPNTAYLYTPDIDIYLADNKIIDIKCIPKQTITRKG